MRRTLARVVQSKDRNMDLSVNPRARRLSGYESFIGYPFSMRTNALASMIHPPSKQVPAAHCALSSTNPPPPLLSTRLCRKDHKGGT